MEEQPIKRKGSEREEGKAKKQKVDELEKESASHEDQSEGGSAALYAPGWDSLDKRPAGTMRQNLEFLFIGVPHRKFNLESLH